MKEEDEPKKAWPPPPDEPIYRGASMGRPAGARAVRPPITRIICDECLYHNDDREIFCVSCGKELSP